MALYSRGNARRSLIDTAIFRVAAQLSTAVAYVVMVRGMTKEDFGVFNLLYSFIPVVSTLASLGLEQALRRYQPEYLRAGNLPAAAWLFRFVASARFGSNVVLLGLILLTWTHVAPIFKLAEYKPEFAFFCLPILLHFQVSILQLSFASHMMQRYAVGSVAAMSLLKLVTYAWFVHFGSLTLEMALVADTLAYALVYALMTILHRRNCASGVAPLAGFRLEPDERKRLIRYGVYNNFNDAGSLALSTKADNFYIAAFIDPIAVAVYSFYTRLGEMVASLLPIRMFEGVVQPLFFSTPKVEAVQRLPAYFSLLTNLNLILQWPALAYAVAYHSEIVHVVFGGKYAEGSWLLPLILAVSILNVIAVPATMVAQYEEKARMILISKAFAVYNILALLVLVPLFGLYGAAVASGSAQTFKNLFIWWNVRDLAMWINAGAAVVTGVLLWGVVIAFCELLKVWIDAPQLFHLVIGAFVCMAGGLLHLRSPALSGSDRRLLASVLQGKESRLLTHLGLLGRTAKGD